MTTFFKTCLTDSGVKEFGDMKIQHPDHEGVLLSAFLHHDIRVPGNEQPLDTCPVCLKDEIRYRPYTCKHSFCKNCLVNMSIFHIQRCPCCNLIRQQVPKNQTARVIGDRSFVLYPQTSNNDCIYRLLEEVAPGSAETFRNSHAGFEATFDILAAFLREQRLPPIPLATYAFRGVGLTMIYGRLHPIKPENGMSFTQTYWSKNRRETVWAPAYYRNKRLGSAAMTAGQIVKSSTHAIQVYKTTANGTGNLVFSSNIKGTECLSYAATFYSMKSGFIAYLKRWQLKEGWNRYGASSFQLASLKEHRENLFSFLLFEANFTMIPILRSGMIVGRLKYDVLTAEIATRLNPEITLVESEVDVASLLPGIYICGAHAFSVVQEQSAMDLADDPLVDVDYTQTPPIVRSVSLLIPRNFEIPALQLSRVTLTTPDLGLTCDSVAAVELAAKNEQSMATRLNTIPQIRICRTADDMKAAPTVNEIRVLVVDDHPRCALVVEVNNPVVKPRAFALIAGPSPQICNYAFIGCQSQNCRFTHFLSRDQAYKAYLIGVTPPQDLSNLCVPKHAPKKVKVPALDSENFPLLGNEAAAQVLAEEEKKIEARIPDKKPASVPVVLQNREVTDAELKGHFFHYLRVVKPMVSAFFLDVNLGAYNANQATAINFVLLQTGLESRYLTTEASKRFEQLYEEVLLEVKEILLKEDAELEVTAAVDNEVAQQKSDYKKGKLVSEAQQDLFSRNSRLLIAATISIITFIAAIPFAAVTGHWFESGFGYGLISVLCFIYVYMHRRGPTEARFGLRSLVNQTKALYSESEHEEIMMEKPWLHHHVGIQDRKRDKIADRIQFTSVPVGGLPTCAHDTSRQKIDKMTLPTAAIHNLECRMGNVKVSREVFLS